MASQKTKFTVGVFVASGLGIALLTFIWLGMSRYFEEGRFYVTYFDQSVQGLDVDSPVKYRGVSVGRVVRIDVAPDSRLIQVVMTIETGQKLETDIVAQLKNVGITGSVFVELDRRKEGEADLSPAISFPSEYEIVASKSSEISKLLQGIDDVFKQVRALNLDEISSKVKTTLDGLNEKISDANVKGISDKLEGAIKGIDQIASDEKWDRILISLDNAGRSLGTVLAKSNKSLDRVDKIFERVEGIVVSEEMNVKKAIEDLGKAMENANNLFAQGSSLVRETDDSLFQLQRHILVITQNLERASGNLNRLIEFLADQPSQLIAGQPPKPRKLERDFD